MSEPVEKAATWIYRGVWKVLSDWFRVPESPPTLPAPEGAFIRHFHPSLSYLRYLKFYFWILLVVVDVAIFVGWFLIYKAAPAWGVGLALPAFVLAVAPDVVAYVAIHLRYDTMWYVMTDQSLRCRRGIWTILEHTITFENVQNVGVRRGPIQYFFGIFTIVVETAGATEPDGENQYAVGNKAIMEGIGNPDEIRQLIMDRVRRSKTAGLGDEPKTSETHAIGWSDESLAVLNDIREAVMRRRT